MIDIGASVSYSTIITPALRGLNNATNPDETVVMSESESSWLGKHKKQNSNYRATAMNEKIFKLPLTTFVGSSAYLTKLVGGLVCGWVSDGLGRKNAMILVNIPVMIAWALFYFSTSMTEIFIANCLLSFSSGFIKTPSVAYCGEVW